MNNLLQKSQSILADPPFKWDNFHASSTTSIPSLRQINDNDCGRYYVVPDNTNHRLFSVTNILGDDPEKKRALEEWRKRIGREEANRISRNAAGGGTRVHNLLEQFVKNESINADSIFPDVLPLFKGALNPLRKSITEVSCLEQRLYSYNLGAVGIVDGIVTWNGNRSILDFKTSSKEKKKEWILDYFLQTTAYSLMWEELTGERIDQLVIFIMIHTRPDTPQVFIEDRQTYIPTLLRRIYDFHKRRNLTPPKIFVDILQET